MEAEVLDLGSMNIDKVYSVDSIVAPGETISSLSYSEHCGGKGLNQAIALAKAGAKVAMAGCLGLDGEGLKEVLKLNGVCTSLIKEVAGPSGHAIIQVNKKGQNSIIVSAGSNGLLSEEYLDEVFEAFTNKPLVLFQNEINATSAAVRKAKAKGFQVAFNASPITSSIFSFPLDLVDIFFINEVEAKALSGFEGEDYKEILEAICKKYPNALIVMTIGKSGVLCGKGEGEVLHHGIYEVPVVDSTAAGDTFLGFFLASLCKGLALKEALRRASIASSIAVSRKGASSSIPTLEEVLSFTGQEVLK